MFESLSTPSLRLLERFSTEFQRPPSLSSQSIAFSPKQQRPPSPPSPCAYDEAFDRRAEWCFTVRLTDKLSEVQRIDEENTRNGKGREEMLKRRSTDELSKDAWASVGGWLADMTPSTACSISRGSSFLSEETAATEIAEVSQNSLQSQEPTVPQTPPSLPSSNHSVVSFDTRLGAGSQDNVSSKVERSIGNAAELNFPASKQSQKLPVPTQMTPATDTTKTLKRSLTELNSNLPTKRRRVHQEISTSKVGLSTSSYAPLRIVRSLQPRAKPVQRSVQNNSSSISRFPALRASNRANPAAARSSPKRSFKQSQAIRLRGQISRIHPAKILKLPKRRRPRLQKRPPGYKICR